MKRRDSFCWERTQLGGKHQEETGAEKWGRGENRKEEVRTQNKPLGPAIPEASACLAAPRKEPTALLLCLLLFSVVCKPKEPRPRHIPYGDRNSHYLLHPTSEPELGLGEGIIGEAREEHTLRIRRQPRLREEARDQAIPLGGPSHGVADHLPDSQFCKYSMSTCPPPASSGPGIEQWARGVDSTGLYIRSKPSCHCATGAVASLPAFALKR